MTLHGRQAAPLLATWQPSPGIHDSGIPEAVPLALLPDQPKAKPACERLTVWRCLALTVLLRLGKVGDAQVCRRQSAQDIASARPPLGLRSLMTKLPRPVVECPVEPSVHPRIQGTIVLAKIELSVPHSVSGSGGTFLTVGHSPIFDSTARLVLLRLAPPPG